MKHYSTFLYRHYICHIINKTKLLNFLKAITLFNILCVKVKANRFTINIIDHIIVIVDQI